MNRLIAAAMCFLLAAGLGAGGLQSAAAASAATTAVEEAAAYTLHSTKDTWVQGGANANTVYGTSDKMKVKRTSAENRDAFLQFDASAVTGQVYAAELRLYVVSMESANITGGGEYNLEVRGMADDNWSEETLTYATAPADEGAVIGTITVKQEHVGAYVSLDVSDYAAAHTDRILSFRIRGVELSKGADYATKEHEFAPELRVMARAPSAPDTQPPTVPTAVQAELLADSSVKVTWNASTDNSGTVTYVVYRNDAERGRTQALLYTEEGLAPGVTYTYRVYAVDPSGNVSASSEGATVTTAGQQLAVPVSEDSYTRSGSGPFGTSTTMNVKSNSSGTDIRRAYLKFQAPAYSGNLESAVVKLYVTSLESSTPAEGYDVTLYGIDSDAWSEADLTDANRPQEVGVGLEQVRVNADKVGTYIEFEAADFVRGQTDGIMSFYVESTARVSRGANYATKENGLNQPPLLVLGIVPLAVPAAPADVAAEAVSKRVELTWSRSAHAAGYRIYRSSEGSGYELVGETTSTSYTDSAVVNDQTYSYKLKAVNDAFESDWSEAVSASPKYPLAVQNVQFHTLEGELITVMNGHAFVTMSGELANLSADTHSVLLRIRMMRSSNGGDIQVAATTVQSKLKPSVSTSFQWSVQANPAESAHYFELSVLDAHGDGAQELYHTRQYWNEQ